MIRCIQALVVVAEALRLGEGELLLGGGGVEGVVGDVQLCHA